MQMRLMPEVCGTSSSAWHLRFIGKPEEKVAGAWLLSAGPYSIAPEVSTFQQLPVPSSIRAANGVLVSFHGGVTAKATGRAIEPAGRSHWLLQLSYL